MARSATGDTDFTAARLHGRRGELADGAKLDELCRIRTVAELCRKLGVDCGTPPTATSFQRSILADYASELTELAQGVPAEYAAFFDWQRNRFQIENAKVAIRGLLAGRKPSDINAHLVGLALPDGFTAGEAFRDSPWQILPKLGIDDATTRTVESFAALYSRYPFVFTLECAVDHAYYAELLRRAAQCRDEDGGIVQTARHEVMMFLTMLALRGNANYGIDGDVLSAFFIEGTPLSRSAFARLATARSVEAKTLIEGIAVDALGEEPTVTDIESACWNRYLRLANRLFRRGHMNASAIAGFVGLRRIEVANLITLSEGLRLGMDGRAIRARLIPRTV